MTVRILLVLTLMAIIFGVVQARTATIGYTDLLKRPATRDFAKIAYGTDPNQFGELWLPAGPGPFPVVIIIHGGCWLESLPGTELTAYIAADLRAAGTAVWNLEYRRLSDQNPVGYPDMFLDIANGVDYLRKIAPAHRLDLSNITAVGHSAGGHLALWAAGRDRLKKESPLYMPEPLKIQKVVTLGGINDLQAYKETNSSACGPAVIDRLIDSGNRDNPYADTSPAAMLPLGIDQAVVSGALDPIVPAALGRDYAEKAKSAGDKVEAVAFEGAGHFELIDPQSQAWPKIRSIITEKSGRAE